MTDEATTPATQGLLDTSVVLGLEQIAAGALPLDATITLAELAAGPHATDDTAERARRQDRLQRIEALLDPLPFDAAAARANGLIYAATRAHERTPRGSRAVDLLIAATALANDLPLSRETRQISTISRQWVSTSERCRRLSSSASSRRQPHARRSEPHSPSLRRRQCGPRPAAPR